MPRTIEDVFCAYLDALAADNRPAMIEAVADLWGLIEYEKAKPPRFMTLLHRMEEQVDRLRTNVERVEFAATRVSRIADRHAEQFYQTWVQHMPQRWQLLLSEDVLGDVIRRAIEEVIGETRQGDSKMSTPDEVLEEYRKILDS